ncbi:bestrophin-like domain [Ralstonia flatus]|uniref:DUF4239 domain-containing protein n=1 Tax=Ralstonia flatus TaxID=3058601 RepID=A0AAD2C8I3_9RALS|nr:hypothetical protein [Ralstonia sp. LMG 32965]MBN6208484.1 hypothetical protein [Ralstonia pickettii]CAJ0877066.1 hypothetical protein R77567_02989 [Ralstonia sp. LMG 32965]CAJ0884529.1 hypothetical protein R77564_02944 [Ralstonia sp. LMG 32965]
MQHFDYYSWLFTLSTPALLAVCFISLGLVSAAASVGSAALARLWPIRPGANIIGTLLTGLLVPTAVIIGFISSDIWTQNARAEAAVEREGIAAAEALRILDALPSHLAVPIRVALLAYVHSAVEDEWPAMAQRRASPATGRAFMQLREALWTARPESALAPPTSSMDVRRMDAPQHIAHELDELAKRLDTIENARATRLQLAKRQLSGIKLAAMAWLLFTNAFVIAELHRTAARERRIALTLFTAGFGMIFFLLVLHDRPFAGSVTISASTLSALVD